MSYAVIGTFYERHDKSLPILRRLLECTRTPDEAWLMCETQMDTEVLERAFETLYDLEIVDEWPSWLKVRTCSTPRDDGRYTVLPYAHKINVALDKTKADMIVYLDNGSMPGPDKYKVMSEALEAHPEWGAVYCTQKRTGYCEMVAPADAVVADAFCALNYTQVMHRLTADRWPTSMDLADPDLADGVFWRYLHKTLGDFHPAGGPMIHDDHHMPAPHAQGL